ncbi:LacI family DNA-binding transcriptional regulator [Acidisoma sp.]|uniref:LacI family DNA-binding transcriptional regulator n=1 Tax=Acidisoma sp. TaxID=1872115 RepID=UPI003B004591
MKRPTIADLARAAGVSVSTVDRVLNGRDPVRPDRAEKVLATARAIGFRAEQAIRQRLTEEKPSRTFGFILQREKGAFYRGVAEALKLEVEAAPTIRGRFRVEFLADLTPAFVADRIAAMAKVVDAIGVVAADHPRISQAIGQAHERGVPAITLISDLTAPTRAGYVGLDNWKVGRTAAWAVANMARPDGRVAILVGSHRYLCQDVAEMSFRSYMREHAPGFGVMEAVTTFEDPGYAYEHTLDLIRRTPDLAALWVAGGGIEGVVQAIADAGAADRLVTIGRDLTDDTRAALIDGTIRLVLSHPRRAMAAAAVGAMVTATDEAPPPFQQVLLPFELWTAENV